MISRRDVLRGGAGLVAGRFLNVAKVPAGDEDRPALVDCHTHFYDPARPEGVPWPGKDDEVLYRTVLPKHFLELSATLGVTKTVVVEASPWLEDNAWLLTLAETNPSIVGIVGNLAPGQPQFADHLRRFAANKLFRGIRIGHDTLRKGLALPAFLADVRRLAERGVATLTIHRPVEASQMPANTAATPTARLNPIGSPSRIAATIEAVTGLSVIALATRVGVVRARAKTQRKKVRAAPMTTR
jgi:hypothetical protein